MKKYKIGDVRYSYSRTREVYTKPGFWSVGDDEELPPDARVFTRAEVQAVFDRHKYNVAEGLSDPAWVLDEQCALDELFGVEP